MILYILFWIPVALILHTYVLYPLILLSLDRLIPKKAPYAKPGFIPNVSVLMAVHNEEVVLREKIKSLFGSDYPADSFEVLVGSDASDDNTNEILNELTGVYPALRVFMYNNRIGKPAIINKLSLFASGEILIITDANVFPERETVSLLVRSFADEKTGLTDTRLKTTTARKDGISYIEGTYKNFESKLKHIEGRLWGTMMGPFGGFYAVRKSSYIPNSGIILADDFRICMNILKRGEKAISDPEAVVCEDIPNNIAEEFRRKTRISAGNFQNLAHFSFLLLMPFTRRGFCFISHKALRWFAPFLWIIALVANILLINTSFFYLLFFILQVIFLILPPLDLFLKKINVNLVPLRLFTHLFFMNMALLAGFLKYLRGIRSGVWTPTKRYI